MNLMRAIGVGVVLVGLAGCGGKPAAAPVESAKSEATQPKQNEPRKVETPSVTEAPPKPTSITDGKAAGDVRDDNGLKMALVWCPPGEFTMGSTIENPLDHEIPVRVTLSRGYWLGRTEVTQGQWQSVMETTPWIRSVFVKKGAAYPATDIRWDDAVTFCRNLSVRERSAGRLPGGWEFRLPTEAEWEYACRAGSTTAYSFGEDASHLGEYAWYGENVRANGGQYPQEVGLKRPNAWGLFDMHGNEWEWCKDGYSDKLPGGRDPVGPVAGGLRMLRGGGWSDPKDRCRSAYRASSETSKFHGFRIVLAPVRGVKAE